MNPRRSNASKAARGTLRADRMKQVPAGERLLEVPPAPGDLSKDAAAEWKRLAGVLVEVGSLTLADLRGLALLCEILADVRALEVEVRRDGYTIEAAGGGRKGNPAAQALATARAQAHRMLADYGLNPRARGSVDQAPGGDQDADSDPAAAYFR